MRIASSWRKARCAPNTARLPDRRPHRQSPPSEVLVYYAIASVAALTHCTGKRCWLKLLGAGGCLVLVATLPWQSVLAGLGMFALGLAGRWLIRRHGTDRVSLGAENPES